MTAMIDDAELLRRFAEARDEAAFAELVERHAGLVYAAALRQLGGAAHRAQDATQSVFIDLARRAEVVSRRTEIVGWLYTSTHYAAAKLKRGEQRRQAREQEAHSMQEITRPDENVEWERLRPVLDEAMLALPERDREAVLLRFFERKKLGEIGRRLGSSEDAARMRVERGLEKLRAWLGRRGIVSTSAALTAALEAGAIGVAPTGLVATVTSAVSAATAGGVATSIFTMATFTWIGAGALVVAGITGLVFQARANDEARREIAVLRSEVAQVATLRMENAALARAAAEVEVLRGDERTLAGLRTELAGLRRQADATQSGLATDPRLTRPRPANEPVAVTLKLPKADYDTVFSAYEVYARKKIMRDPSLAGMSGTIDLTTGLVTVAEAMELLRTTLRETANIVIEELPDGTLRARRGGGR